MYTFTMCLCLQENPRHDSIAIKICNEVLSNPDSFNLKLWVKILNKLELSESNDEAFKELAVLADQMLEVKYMYCTFAYYQHEISFMHKNRTINLWNRKKNSKFNFCGLQGYLVQCIPNKIFNTFSFLFFYI